MECDAENLPGNAMPDAPLLRLENAGAQFVRLRAARVANKPGIVSSKTRS